MVMVKSLRDVVMPFEAKETVRCLNDPLLLLRHYSLVVFVDVG